MHASTLDLGIIGNGSQRARWTTPRGVELPARRRRPYLCAAVPAREHEGGDFAIELEDLATFGEQPAALPRSCAPCNARPPQRRGGNPRLRPALPPERALLPAGQHHPQITAVRCAAHPRAMCARWPTGAHASDTGAATTCAGCCPVPRLTCDVPVRCIPRCDAFILAHPVHLVLGVDEPMERSLPGYVDEALRNTGDYWREWVRLTCPSGWTGGTR